MPTLVLSTGRNLPEGGTLPTDDWDSLCDELFLVAEEIGSPIFFGEVVGTWEGAEEESYVVGFTADSVDLPALDRKLREIARLWGQDAIGRTVHVERNPIPGGWQPIGPSYVERAQ